MDKRSYIRQFSKYQQNREQYFTKKIYKILRDQTNQFLNAYKDGKINPLLSIESASMREVLLELFIDSRHYAALIYSQFPKERKSRASLGFMSWFIKLIIQYFNNEVLNMVEDITRTTRNVISKILIQATEEGLSLNKTVRLITDQAKLINANRARLIARTETVTASNQASYLAAARTGLLMKKEWLSAGDKRVRPDHQEVNGTKIDFEDYFNVGGARMLVPGAVIQENGLPSPASEVCNCRCVVLYEPVRVNGKLVNHDYGLWPTT